MASRLLLLMSTPSSPVLSGTQILTIEDGGAGAALITTAAPHGLSDAAPITISGSSVVGYNTDWVVAGVPSSDTTFKISSYLGDAVGGQWAHNPPSGGYTPSLDFSDSRNSMYVPALAI